MICFDKDESRFNFRSVAVIIQNEHILIHRAAGDDFWALPGGRVELFETSDETIKREIIEELGMKIEILRQLWQVENFFEFGSKGYHELANYFLVKFIDQPTIEPEIDFDGIEKSVDLIFRWIPLSALTRYNLKPSFLIGKLTDLPNSIESVKVNERNA